MVLFGQNPESTRTTRPLTLIAPSEWTRAMSSSTKRFAPLLVSAEPWGLSSARPRRCNQAADPRVAYRRLMGGGLASTPCHGAVSADRQEFDVVLREALVDTHQRQVLRARLGNHHSVERIGMMRCQATCQQSV